MNSLERVLTSLSHKEPDRVPLFLLFGMYGAKEANCAIQDYFRDPLLVADVQLEMASKYKSDCLYTFYYASAELEAFGGSTRFISNGPPNAMEPIFTRPKDILNMRVPDFNETASLRRVLKTTRVLKEKSNDEIPIIGVVMSPLSIPVMQLGFKAYLDLIHDHPLIFEHLLEKNQEFAINWANAQIEAGATAICYFDPISSPTMLSPALYCRYGKPLAKETLAAINGPTATHFASGRMLPVINDVLGTGTQVVSASYLEDLSELKKICSNKVALLGNLNGVEMSTWSPKQAREEVRKALKAASKGGGFILSDNHGEIPYQVQEDVLLAIANAVQEFGTYAKIGE
ncbi:MAG: uroporphyrinogen decarboxylase family protein [Bacteroidetes bacterium]|nr:uroporphyrinogen decarboxylase family protein [Bacteroidota bacterium]